jgi:hypothetical protein
MKSFAIKKLEVGLNDTSGLYVPPDTDRELFFSELRDEILSHTCDPFMVSATVVPPAFPDIKAGERIEGCCVAHYKGYWLIYNMEQDTFYCFWGTDVEHLSAPGISGSPLYCWSS